MTLLIYSCAWILLQELQRRHRPNEWSQLHYCW